MKKTTKPTCGYTTRTRTLGGQRPDTDYTWTEDVRTGLDAEWKHNGTYVQKVKQGFWTKSIVDWACNKTGPDGSIVDCKCQSVNERKKNFHFVKSDTSWFNPGNVFFEHRHTGGNCRLTFNTYRRNNFLYHPDNPIDAVKSRLLNYPASVTPEQLNRGLMAIKPSVEKFLPGVNIYEILGELKDVKKLLSLFTVKKGKAKGGNPMRDSGSDLASRYLAYHFGWVPLVGTVANILQLLLKLDGVIDKWNEFAKQGRIMDFHETLFVDKDDLAFTETSIGGTGTCGWTKDKNYQGSYTSSAKLHLYIIPKPIPDSLRFAVLLRSMGVDKPLSGIWELVPFSWLVDYFVDVSSHVEHFERQLPSLFKFEVKSIGYSIKYSLEASSVERMQTHFYQVGSALSESGETNYTRTPLAPSSLFEDVIAPSWGWSSPPGGKQWTYVLAVLPNLRS